MNKKKELLETIRADKALTEELVQSLKQGADAAEIARLLKAKGIEATTEQVEALLAEAQKASADTITATDVDLDELNRMAGGGDGICDGAANCDVVFSARPDVSKSNRCSWSNYCDEYHTDIVCDKNYHKKCTSNYLW